MQCNIAETSNAAEYLINWFNYTNAQEQINSKFLLLAAGQFLCKCTAMVD